MTSKPSIAKKIALRSGVPDLIELLTERLTGSALNSVLLEVFARKTAMIKPAELLQQYDANRFVHPASGNMIPLLASGLECLRIMQTAGFEPLELSPVSPLGSCSVLGTVDQKKVLFAGRHCEVLADATNAMALHIASLRKKGNLRGRLSQMIHQYGTVQRHLRTQRVEGKGMSAHFTIACLVSSGRDSGSFYFEKTAITNQFLALIKLVRNVFGTEPVRFRLKPMEGYAQGYALVEQLQTHLRRTVASVPVEIDEKEDNNRYYQGVQFKMDIEINGHPLEIADGGFVDWMQGLLENKKERFLISGLGIELINKFQQGLI